MAQTIQHTGNFRREERLGLLVAFILHVLVLAAMLFQPVRDEVLPIPERMTVSLAAEVGLESTAPAPVVEAQAAIAPTLSDELAPAIEDSPAEAQTQSRPQPQPTTPPRANQPTRSPAPAPTQTPRPRPSPTASAAPTQGGGSRIGSNFLPGSGSSATSNDTRIPASEIGRSAQASLRSAITRQLRPHWTAPQGVDVEQLVTVLSFRLNPDGTLAGRPRVVRQTGINASNRPQAPVHAERAIRAVQLAAPFDLPDQYYNGWKTISAWRFDRRL
ncbi:MAG: energy transducer TonB [Erythrobacter sp.]